MADPPAALLRALGDRSAISALDLLALLGSEAPKINMLVLKAIERCCPRERRFEFALAFASHRWNDTARKRLQELLSTLYDGRVGAIGDGLWAHLVARHGPVRGAASLSPEERARLVAQGRVFWVKTTRDGYGSGTVTFHPAVQGAALPLRVEPLETAAPYAFSDEALDVVPWLDSLNSNTWERASDVPGLR